ncbi:hypothetical protein AXH35_11175 [Acidipropionibacterium acidipropionici]|uniref:Uncharacterized protein n=1 Tax=Acidipropionibacterium acidipropionici TaxID=1748 RepID=A0AAC8YFR0_9ACTN|nr:hypothetical protein AXH35_11175 [Acidipropionibacterium acidipropionici]AOZ47379.1 hypothetical protein A8L58_12620 [Acidipropionibacterium acidipropionici]
MVPADTLTTTPVTPAALATFWSATRTVAAERPRTEAPVEPTGVHDDGVVMFFDDPVPAPGVRARSRTGSPATAAALGAWPAAFWCGTFFHFWAAGAQFDGAEGAACAGDESGPVVIHRPATATQATVFHTARVTTGSVITHGKEQLPAAMPGRLPRSGA